MAKRLRARVVRRLSLPLTEQDERDLEVIGSTPACLRALFESVAPGEDVPAERIAKEVGTACYVYSKATFLRHYRQVRDAFAALNPTVCYSVKSCGNINILKFLAAEGCGFDVTSGGELFRAIQAGGDPKKMIYAE